MGFPKTYELNYSFLKKEIGLTYDEILNDVEKKLERDGYTSYRKNSSIEFSSIPRQVDDNFLSYNFVHMRANDMKCKLEFSENKDEINCHFTGFILKASMINLIGKLGMLIFVCIVIENGFHEFKYAIIFGLPFLGFLAFVYQRSINSTLHDIVHYRLFSKYLNNKNLRKSAESASNI